MKRNEFKMSVIIACALLLCSAGYGQVTTGSDQAPPKSKTAVTTVALLALNSLQPLVTADEDITADVRTSYKGTRVNNTTVANGLTAREYIWGGTVWKTPEEYENSRKQDKKLPTHKPIEQ